MAGGYATPNQLYRLNKLGLLVVGKGEPLKPDEADALIRASGWEPDVAPNSYLAQGVPGLGSDGTSDALEP